MIKGLRNEALNSPAVPHPQVVPKAWLIPLRGELWGLLGTPELIIFGEKARMKPSKCKAVSVLKK